MMQSEFTQRTGYTPRSAQEYDVIQTAYLESNLNKDEWCERWLQKQASGQWEIEYPIWDRMNALWEGCARKQREQAKEIERQRQRISELETKVAMLEDEWAEFSLD